MIDLNKNGGSRERARNVLNTEKMLITVKVGNELHQAILFLCMLKISGIRSCLHI